MVLTAGSSRQPRSAVIMASHMPVVSAPRASGRFSVRRPSAPSRRAMSLGVGSATAEILDLHAITRGRVQQICVARGQREAAAHCGPQVDRVVHGQMLTPRQIEYWVIFVWPRRRFNLNAETRERRNGPAALIAVQPAPPL